MSDLIDRDEVIEIIEYVCSADDTYWKPGTLEEIRNLPTHQTPSNTLGALDCIDRQEAIKALCREECGMDPKGCHVGTCYDVEIIEDVPSVQLELSNNSPELENKNGELISRQKAKDAIDMALDHIDHVPSWVYDKLLNALNEVSSAQPDVPDTNVGELISRAAAIDAFWKLEAELRPSAIDAVLDMLKNLPSVQPEIIRCKDCKYVEAADLEDSQDGYTCQFHRGSIWFSGSYCSWAELRGDSDEND